LDAMTSEMQDNLHHVIQYSLHICISAALAAVFDRPESRSMMEYVRLLYSGCDTISFPGCSGWHIDPTRGEVRVCEREKHLLCSNSIQYARQTSCGRWAPCRILF
jgi:hypothetical protein